MNSRKQVHKQVLHITDFILLLSPVKSLGVLPANRFSKMRSREITKFMYQFNCGLAEFEDFFTSESNEHEHNISASWSSNPHELGANYSKIISIKQVQRLDVRNRILPDIKVSSTMATFKTKYKLFPLDTYYILMYVLRLLRIWNTFCIASCNMSLHCLHIFCFCKAVPHCSCVF